VASAAKKDYYMTLPYNRIVQFIRDAECDYYFARVLELEGCFSDGKTEQEALENLRESMEGWLEVAVEHNDPIPEPIMLKSFKPNFITN
jgi:predicted RNase H-like HicB family nuclease